MIRLLPILLLSSLVYAPSPAYCQGDPVTNEIIKGRKFFEEGKYPEAVECFSRVQAMAPTDWRGPAYLSMTMLQQAFEETDRDRQLALTRQAQQVTSFMVKNDLLELHDPLFRFVRAFSLRVAGNHAKAYQEFGLALRSPRSSFERYREIELRRSIERGFAITAMSVGQSLINLGQFEQAEIELEKADRVLPKDDTLRPRYHRLRAVACEQLGKLDDAVEHLRKVIAQSEGNEKLRQELVGSIATIYIENERLNDGRKVLTEVPEDCTHPEVLTAFCSLHFKEAMRARGERLDQALQYFRAAIGKFPVDDRYRVVDRYAKLVLAKVGPREVEEHRTLLTDTIELLLVEVDRRPECPSLYFSLYRIHKLLGNEQEEIHYQTLHARKKKDYESKSKYDNFGRPRCG